MNRMHVEHFQTRPIQGKPVQVIWIMPLQFAVLQMKDVHPEYGKLRQPRAKLKRHDSGHAILEH